MFSTDSSNDSSPILGINIIYSTMQLCRRRHLLMVKIQIFPSLIFPEPLEEVFVNTREILTVLSESLTFLASHCWLGEELDNTQETETQESLKSGKL